VQAIPNYGAQCYCEVAVKKSTISGNNGALEHPYSRRWAVSGSPRLATSKHAQPTTKASPPIYPAGDHDRRADHVGGALLTSGASGHGCFLAVKPNQPEDDGEYGVPDVALPNVALPISHRQYLDRPPLAPKDNKAMPSLIGLMPRLVKHRCCKAVVVALRKNNRSKYGTLDLQLLHLVRYEDAVAALRVSVQKSRRRIFRTALDILEGPPQR
jgi:hypothetical protein